VSQSDFVTRGQALVNSGQYQEAVKVCRLGLLGRPTTVEGRVVLGQALLALKRYDEVLAEMRVALELDHSSIIAQALKGEALLAKGDPHAAIEVLEAARLLSPGDPRIDGLLARAHGVAGKPSAVSASHPSVGFVGAGHDHTRNYPNHAFDDDGEETTGGSFDRPTSVSTPGSKKRSSVRSVARMPDSTPPPSVLAVGDKSGTVEVDPELDGVELSGEDDFGDVVSPPRSRQQPLVDNPRGQVMSSRRGPAPRPAKNPMEISSVELMDDDMLELDASETLLPPAKRQPLGPGPGTRVRNAVNVPSGPLDVRSGPAAAPTAAGPAQHAPLAHMIANAPHVLEVAQPQVSATVRGNPAGPIAAALPTMAAQPPPPMHGPGPHHPAHAPTAIGVPPIHPAAVHPTMALQPDPGMIPGSPGWARATVAAGHPQPLQPPPGSLGGMPGQPIPPHLRPDEPTGRPPPISPELASILEGPSGDAMLPAAGTSSVIEPSHSGARALKTGMRKGRSKLQIAIWLIIGGLVIAGGVFVGFKFRAMRLEKKIADTRDIALNLAKADTWKGLVRSRDRLAGIAQASPTEDNLAALARSRAQIAYEFGDGVPDAKHAVDALSGQSGLDVELADAYLKLAQHDAKNALVAAHRATQAVADDPAALYVTGSAEMLGGEIGDAIDHLKQAVAKEARPLYLIALARAYAEDARWADAASTLDPKHVRDWFTAVDPDTTRELGASGIEVDKLALDHPGIAIARAQIAVESGQLGTQGKDLHARLDSIVSEGSKGLNDQPRGVSPAQLAFAYLTLCELDYQLGNSNSQLDFQKALNVGLDDEEFAERAIETLYFTNDFAGAHKAADRALKEWPNSRRAAMALARIHLAEGQPNQAMDAIGKLDVDKQPATLALRGAIRIALGDIPAATEDFDRALGKSADYEPAVVGRAWADLAAGNVDAARSRMTKYLKGAKLPDHASPDVATVWAAIQRNTPDHREEAMGILEKLVAGPPGAALLRAQLELARAARELGDTRARDLYAKVLEVTSNPEVKLELATYLIEFQNPDGGRETFDDLLKNAGPQPRPEIVLEAARAHMLAGDHKGAMELLDRADKLPGVARWKYDRERGRLSLRRGDVNGAATSLEKALAGCGADTETFYLAAEVAAGDDEHKPLHDLVSKLAGERLKNTPESKIVQGKLLLSKGEDASKLYDAAKNALEKKASPRRRAQAVLGLAIVAYNNRDDPTAIDRFDLAVTLDPSLYEAYVYLADIQKDKDPKKALERARQALRYNPDNADAWMYLGIAAHKVGNRKVLKEAVTALGALAPSGEQLKALQQLR